MFLDELDPKVTEGSKGPFVILVKITYNMDGFLKTPLVPSNRNLMF